MFAISNDELESKPKLISPTQCPFCKQLHDIQYGDIINQDGSREKSKLVAYIECSDNGKCYLVGVNGKNIK